MLVSLQCQSDCKTPKPYSAPDQSLYHLLTQLLILCEKPRALEPKGAALLVQAQQVYLLAYLLVH